VRKRGKSQVEDIPSRVIQEEERRLWMNEVPNEGDYGEENDAPRGSSTLVRKRSPTPDWESTSKSNFNELISTIHNMMGAITTMQR